MKHVLVIDDDRKLQTALTRLFEFDGCEVSVASTGTMGLEQFRNRPPCITLLDLNLPELRGEEVLREIKRVDSKAAVVILSAHADPMDKVVLLELGADDYVTKPFSPKELLARVHTVVRRMQNELHAEEIHLCQDIRLNPAKLTLIRPDAVIPLSFRECRILLFLKHNSARAVSREELLGHMWIDENRPSSRLAIETYIRRLRVKLEADPSHPVHLVTVHGLGYQLRTHDETRNDLFNA